MNLYQSFMTIGNKSYQVLATNYKEEAVEDKVVELQRLHHIHLLDRSGSMWRDMDSLIKNVKQTVDLMEDGDLISIIYFSDVDECEPIIIGKNVSEKQDIHAMLDSINSTLSVTCFSKPLQETIKLVEKMSPICSNFNVTLFTDGYPVTYHSREKEIQMINDAVSELKGKVMAINSIGYGNYYDKQILESISNSTDFGRVFHSNNIDDYSEIFSRNRTILATMTRENVKIETNEGNPILYVSSRESKLTETTLDMGYLDKTRNWFFIFLDEGTEDVTINGEKIDVSTVTKEIPKLAYENMAYALSYELYYAGRLGESLDTLAIETGSKHLIDNHYNAFTPAERQKHMDLLKQAAYGRGKKALRAKDGFVDSSYLPKADAFCFMDLLKILIEGVNYYIPKASSEYNNITRKTTDTFNLFKADDKPLASLIGDNITMNKAELNISFRYMVNGIVNINPKQASAVGLESEINSRIFRNQTIIRDGHLNMDTIEILADKNTYNRIGKKLADNGIPFTDVVVETEAMYIEGETLTFDEIRMVLNLTKLPVINREYADDSTVENILRLVAEQNKYKAEQKVVNYYINQMGKAKPSLFAGYHGLGATNEGEGTKTTFNDAQLELLKEHGLDNQLRYSGVNRVIAEKVETDSYETRSIEFGLKGWSSLPSVADVQAKAESGKKLNAPAVAMHNEILDTERVLSENPEEVAFGMLMQQQQNLKRVLTKIDIDLNTLKMAKVLTGTWWTGLELNKKEQYEFTNEDKETLIIKLKFDTKYF